MLTSALAVVMVMVMVCLALPATAAASTGAPAPPEPPDPESPVLPLVAADPMVRLQATAFDSNLFLTGATERPSQNPTTLTGTDSPASYWHLRTLSAPESGSTTVALQNVATGRWLKSRGPGVNTASASRGLLSAYQWTLDVADGASVQLRNVRTGRYLDGDENPLVRVDTHRLRSARGATWTLVSDELAPTYVGAETFAANRDGTIVVDFAERFENPLPGPLTWTIEPSDTQQFNSSSFMDPVTGLYTADGVANPTFDFGVVIVASNGVGMARTDISVVAAR